MPSVPSPADAGHDDTAPTDHDNTHTGQAADIEAREAERGVADIAQRLLPVLPALRTGALLSAIGAVVLFFAWPSGVRTAPLWGMPPAVMGILWMATVIVRPRPSRFRDPVHGSPIAVIRTAIAVLAMSGIAVFAVWMMWECLSTWSSVLSRTGINTVDLIAIAAGTARLALLSITDILIRMLRGQPCCPRSSTGRNGGHASGGPEGQFSTPRARDVGHSHAPHWFWPPPSSLPGGGRPAEPTQAGRSEAGSAISHQESSRLPHLLCPASRPGSRTSTTSSTLWRGPPAPSSTPPTAS